MKTESTACLLVAAFFIYYQNSTNAQNPDYLNRFYVPIMFDYHVRGAYNVSECLEELLTCWEHIRPWYMCTAFRMKESLCTNMREYCHDEHGDYPISWFNMDLAEHVCKERYDNRES